MSAPTTILITGGGGMLAQALRPAVTHAFADSNVLTPPRKELDVGDAEELQTFFRRHRPAIVFNCAAYTKVDLAEKERAAADACNGTAVGNLARLCREQDA